MGKRELLLVAAFVAVGFVVYQVTAPPADPTKPGFSFSNFMGEIRREIRGQRASAEVTNTTPIPLPASATEIRLTTGSATVTITGEDRDDIEAELHVRSTGYENEEAVRLAKETRLKIDEAGPLLIMSIVYPRDGRQTARLTLKVPRRIALRMDGKGGPLKVADLAGVSLGTSRGDTTIERISGPVTLDQRGSQLIIAEVGRLRLNGVAIRDGRISGVSGDVTLTLNGGELVVEKLGGALEVETRNAEVRFEQLEQLKGPVRVNATAGELTFSGLATDARIDGRVAEIRIEQAKPAPLAVYNTEQNIELTLPDGGVTLDTMATSGRISLDETLQKANLTITEPPSDARAEAREMRVTGAVRGGGPSITLRTTRGDIVLGAKR